MTATYSLGDIRNGTGWPDGVRFVVADGSETALDAICRELDGREWSADTLDAIADIVRASGRIIREPFE